MCSSGNGDAVPDSVWLDRLPLLLAPYGSTQSVSASQARVLGRDRLQFLLQISQHDVRLEHLLMPVD